MSRYYISDGVEYLEFGDTKKDLPFPESLIRFLYIDIEQYDAELKSAGKALRDYYPSGDDKYLSEVKKVLDELAGAHVYFEYLRYDFLQRMEKAHFLKRGGSSVLDLIPHEELPRIYSEACSAQRNIKGLFAAVMDRENAQLSVEEYLSAGEHDKLHTYCFRGVRVSYEIVDGELRDVLYPESYLDIADYALRECVKQRVYMRVCKICGHYFPISAGSKAEYCDITRDANGRSCRGVGPMRAYTERKKENEIFTEYRREYKRRFGWIRAGRIEPNDFYAWSAMAKEQEAACERGEITFDEFKKWLTRP